MFTFYYIFLIIFLPLLNFFIYFFFYSNFKGFFLIKNKKKVLINDFFFFYYYFIYKFFNFINIAVINIFYSFYLVFLLTLKMITKNIFLYNFNFLNWFELGVLNCSFGLIVDRVTIVMLFVVLFISLIVHIYSIDYMNQDPFIMKFFSTVSLFTFFMLFLVTSNNLIQIFLGWEGVSLCSYLLINFWSSRIQANKSSIKAFIINRITDFFLIISFFLIIQYFNNMDLNSIFSVIAFFKDKEIYFLVSNFKLIDIISLFIFLGSIGKSAQIFFHTWLPDAMEGPTPVSALIHSATMVTAGIFMVVRFSPIIEYSENTLQIMLFLGSLTALYGGIVALFQYDIKKIIAFSTCSQLGYMFVACGVSGYNVSLFHLFNHSFFKALLFLSSGIIIHIMSNEQDIRKFGSFYKILPFIYILFLIGCFSLIGFPFLTGFYSKEVIIELLIEKETIIGELVYWLILISVFFTASYVTRLFFFCFFYKTNSYKRVLMTIEKKIDYMVISVLFLAIGSIYFGFYFKEIFMGVGSNFFDNSFLILPQHNQKIDNHFILKGLKLLPVFIVFTGIFFTSFYYIYSVYTFFKLKDYYFILEFLNRKFYFDKLYNIFFVKTVLYISFNKFYKIFDKKIFNFLGYTNSNNINNKIGSFFLFLEKRNSIHSLFIIYITVLIFLCLIFDFYWGWYDDSYSKYVLIYFIGVLLYISI